MSNRGPVYLNRDVDEIDLEVLLSGRIAAHRVHCSVRAAAVRILTERGVSCANIAAKLQMSKRTVQRYRAKVRA